MRASKRITNRLVLIGAAVLAAALVAAPTVLGLTGNTSFSRDLEVPVPSGARSVHFAGPSPAEPSESTALDTPHDAATEVREARRGSDVAAGDATDDHGGLRGTDHSGPGDRTGASRAGGDRGGADDGRRDDSGSRRGHD
jgi:hypothetical protein